MPGVYALMLRVLSFRQPRETEPAPATPPAPAYPTERRGESSGERRLRVLRAIQGDLRRRPSGNWRPPRS
jgi:hypothetical protein